MVQVVPEALLAAKQGKKTRLGELRRSKEAHKKSLAQFDDALIWKDLG